MSFSSLFKGIGNALSSGLKALNPVSLALDGIKTIGGLVTSNHAQKNANHLADKQMQAQAAANQANIDFQREANQANIDFQREANQANIASQEKINQQNIDFQKGINDLMRRDSRNAISDKRADLMRAGYSTADPSMSGFSAASLTSPTLTAPQSVAPQVQAPHVESEFSPAMAETLIGAKNSSISNLLSMLDTASSLSLRKAQERNTNANTDLVQKEIDWYDLKQDALYKNLIADLDLKVKDGTIKDYVAQDLANQLSMFDLQRQKFTEDLESVKLDNEYQRKTMQDRVSIVTQRLDELRSLVQVNKDKHDMHKINKAKAKVDLAIRQLEKQFMEYGISPNGTDMFSTLARILTSKNGQRAIVDIGNFVSQCLKGLSQSFQSFISDGFDQLKDRITPSFLKRKK